MVDAGFRVDDPDTAMGISVHLVSGQPGSNQFFLTWIAGRIGPGVESQNRFRARDSVTNLRRDRPLLGNVIFIAPHAYASVRESLQERSRPHQIVSAITEEQIPGGRHSVLL